MPDDGPDNEQDDETVSPIPASGGIYNQMISRTVTGSDPLVQEPLK